MPVYKVYHPLQLDGPTKEKIAIQLTDLHSSVTGAPRGSVKVIFLYLDVDSFFSGGKRKQAYLRLSAQIRRGRTTDERMRILRSMYEIVDFTTAYKGSEVEIQTQIIEIDDTDTVMTNGILNT